jgi:hypothetical protein
MAKHERQLLLDWYGEMVSAYRERLSDQDRTELAAWEERNLGTLATSDWAGWERFIAKRPAESSGLRIVARRRA